MVSGLKDRSLHSPVTSGRYLTVLRMQYQPSPRKHTQNIFLAMSIMYDLRFHKPRELPRQGDENGEPGVLAGGLRADELRAVIGLFSVALR